VFLIRIAQAVLTALAVTALIASALWLGIGGLR
jgi:hypothetical protein